jgi:hypothetical protein
MKDIQGHGVLGIDPNLPNNLIMLTYEAVNLLPLLYCFHSDWSNAPLTASISLLLEIAESGISAHVVLRW